MSEHWLLSAPPTATGQGSPDRCANCRSDGDIEQWYGDGGALAVTHGFYKWWCRRCILTAQLKYALKQAERIPALQEELAALAPVQADPGPSTAETESEAPYQEGTPSS